MSGDSSEEWQEDDYVTMNEQPEETIEMSNKPGRSENPPFKSTEAPKPEAPVATEADSGSPEHLEKVRDILFGSQARSFGRKLERLEERITTESAQTREEFRNRLDAIESYFKDEIGLLTDGLRTEERKRSTGISDVVAELQSLARAFDLRADEIEEQFGQRERQLAQQISQSARDLDSALRELTRRFERETRGLRDDKTDRMALASLLNDIATRLQRSPASGSE